QAGWTPATARPGLRPAGVLRLGDGRSGTRHARGPRALRDRLWRQAGGGGLSHGNPGGDSRRRAPGRRVRAKERGRRRGPHVPDVADRRERGPPGAVPRRPLRSRRNARRHQEPHARGAPSMRAWLVRLVARVPVTVHAKLLTAFLVIVLL